MNKKIVTLILCLISIIAFSSFNTYQNVTADDSYYSSVMGLEGEELLNALADLTQANHTNYNNYGEVRYMYEADKDPNNPANTLDFYSHISVKGEWDGGNTWNREHVWPQSLSGGLYNNTTNSTRGAGGDIHHLRPAIPNINSSRQDKLYTDFDYIEATGTAKYFEGVLVAYDSTGLWEPLDNVKGDAARILMYLYMHYSLEVEANSDHSYAGNLSIENVVYTDEGTSEAAWELLCIWNSLDPVDDFEMNRNIYCYNVTGVYNPFIDHPEFADLIFSESGIRVSYAVESGVTFNYNDKTSYEEGDLIAKPTIDPVRNGYDFKGWTSVKDSTTPWNFSTNTVTENITLYPRWEKAFSYDFIADVNSIKCQLAFNYNTIEVENAAAYKLVKNINELSAGDEIIIVNNEAKVAISTNQKSNNRGTASVNIENETIQYLGSDVQIIELVTGTVANTFGFKVDTKYLYAANSSSNYLRSSASLDANGSWLITIDASTGSATIKAQGSNTRNWLRFNKTSDLFSCYGSGQQDVFIYKSVPANGTGYELTKLDIIYTYSISETVYNKYNGDYNFGFLVDEVYTNASSVKKEGNEYIVSITIDSTEDLDSKYNIKPAIYSSSSNTLYIANVSNSYSVKDLITKYLAITSGSGLSSADLEKIEAAKEVLNYFLHNC